MATFPVATGARLLGIHPKTLHHWLKAANVPLAAHPTDARLKCVAEEHLLTLASLHGRPLPDLSSAHALEQDTVSGGAAEFAHGVPSASLADLLHQLSQMQAHVATLQHHLVRLTLDCFKSAPGTLHNRYSPPTRLCYTPWHRCSHSHRPPWEIRLLPPLLQSLASCLWKYERGPASRL